MKHQTKSSPLKQKALKYLSGFGKMSLDEKMEMLKKSEGKAYVWKVRVEAYSQITLGCEWVGLGAF